MPFSRFVAAALTALAFPSASAQADQLLGPGRIDSAGRVILPGGPALGRWQNNLYTATPDNLSVAKPGNRIPFQRPESGAVVRSYDDKMQDTLQAADFGVKCDGTSDIVPALARALNAGKGYVAGREILLPPGLCAYGSTTLLSGSNITISGAGRDKTVMKPLAPGYAAFQIGNPSDVNPWVAPNVGAFSTALMSLRNFTIDTIGKGSGAIIIDKSSTQTTLDGMGFNGNPPGGYLVLAYGDTVKISNGSCYLGDPTAWCYGFDTWGHNHEITGNTLYGFGGYGNGGNGVRILQTQYGIPKVAISSITSAGGVATVTTSSPHGYTTGTYVAIRGAAQAAYNITYSAPITVTGPATFTYPVSGSPASSATVASGQTLYATSDVYGTAHRIEGAVISRNFFLLGGPQAIEINSSLYTRVINNVVDQAIVRNITVQNNAAEAGIISNYIGSAGATTNPSNIGIEIAPNVGWGTKVVGNDFLNLNFGLVADSDGSGAIPDLAVIGNNFNLIGTASLVLNSVRKGVITGNIDSGSPAGGSVWTAAAYSPGTYAMAGNIWSASPSTVWDTASSYTTGNVNGRYSGAVRQVVTGSANGTAYPANATAPQFVGAGISSNESTVNIPMPFAGTLRNLTVATNASPGTGQSYTAIVIVNGGQTALACTITGAVQACTDTSRAAPVAAGQTFSLQVTGSSGSAAALFRFSAEFDPMN
ncbi:glycoside hydrolase family 55 protein [Methylobacterium persicinum]|uniref:Pectate lyase superfamily protein domain-containing protein n=1 Tax=Methylobacterium persicinum TaxID=374426 RepID=A0ABU0HQS6_9HYPH|nr:glycoside hydrolase family 55 protein [Methylobacterium persicinum]MDQ0444677.1 hypothetical protein [Methylobacterium persicinum]GJE38545.1 hypothetical protein KHHGKMAE_2618 [Methylobacterium persicinum]